MFRLSEQVKFQNSQPSYEHCAASSMAGRAAFMGDEDDDDLEALTIIDPSMGVRRVTVDPMLRDHALVAKRKLGRSRNYFGFWGRARSVFSNSVLTSPEVQALREGESQVPVPASAQRHDEETDEDESPRMGDEKRFSTLMHEEWVRCLREEISFLRLERHNEMLEEEQRMTLDMRSKGRSNKVEASVSDLAKSPWAGSEMDGFSNPPPFTGGRPPRSSNPISETSSVQNTTTSNISGNKSLERSQSRRGLRHLQSLAVTHHLDRTASFPPGHSDDGVAPIKDNYSSIENSSIPEQHPVASSSLLSNIGITRRASLSNGTDRSLSADQMPESAEKNEQSGAGKLGSHRWSSRRTNSSPSVPNFTKKRHARHSSIGDPTGFVGPSQIPPSIMKVTSVERTTSGVRAAKAAAVAAATGGHRITRVWEKMKGMLKHSKPDDKGGKLPAGSSLSNRLRLGVIPPEDRGKTWVALACSTIEDNPLSRSRYQHLLRQPSKFAKEIERDVNRTFPLHSKFQEERGPGQKALFNVIKAYSVMDEEVGYCQGMGFVAATLLMHMGEEDAFGCLVYLLYSCGLRAVFLPDMAQLQVRLYQLSQLLMECLPRLHEHLEKLEIKPVMYAADWFLTFFARTLPLYIVFRVFDIIIAEKTSAIIFKLALVLMQVCRHQLNSCSEMEFAMYFLRTDLPEQLQALEDSELEELLGKALRVELPFESLLRLEAEYELLAEEAAMAAREVQAAAAASEAAAASWEKSREDLENRLLTALGAQKAAEDTAEVLQRCLDVFLEGEGEGSRATVERALNVAKGSETIENEEDENGAIILEYSQQKVNKMPLWQRKISAEDLESTTALLKTVATLRNEKGTISEALCKAECALADRLRLDNELIRDVGGESMAGRSVEEQSKLKFVNDSETIDLGLSKAAMGYRDTDLSQLHAGQLTYGNPGGLWPKDGVVVADHKRDM